MQNPKLLFHPKCSPKPHKASRAKTNKKTLVWGPRDLMRGWEMQAHHEALVLSSLQEASLGLLHRRVPQVPKGPKAAPRGHVPVGPGMPQTGAAPASASQCSARHSHRHPHLGLLVGFCHH